MNNTENARTTTSSSIHQLDPRRLLLDVNIRADLRMNPDFIESIREQGVIVPIVAIITGDDEVWVRHGHRRVHAAIDAGHLVILPESDADGSSRHSGHCGPSG